METSYKICSYCKGANHSEAYKLKASNFSNVRVDIFSGTNTQPLPMVPLPENTNKHYNAIICNECLINVNGPLVPVITAMETAKANDAETAAVINS